MNEREREKTARPTIYQMLVRTFGNTNETRKSNGTLRENGCGKFSQVNEAALASLKEMGFDMIWFTGVLEQASGTDYPTRPADVPDILKGIAGSPYAIRDYFDVCPDYADVPENRLEEFKAMLGRCKDAGMRAIIDLVPNHVARSYDSDVRPASSFGATDDRSVFFSRDNHFFHLGAEHPGGGPPLRLPTGGNPGCEGLFAPEALHGRVTGNNAITWAPSPYDWYETVKLNYGHDFTEGRDTSSLPAADADPAMVPKTWRTMDEIIAHWQKTGVDGFRVDMAHMIPMEFWRWVVRRARARDAAVFFCAEAYDNDPAKLTEGNVLDALLDAGFDAVYDDPAYKVLQGIYTAGNWANDLDGVTFIGDRFHRSLRYGENHDEVRLANPGEWGGVGMAVGKPVSAVLFALGRGPVMMYHGQEIGEPALGSEGYAGDNHRTTIFDYWCMPEFAKWVNGGRYDGGRLSAEQSGLREWYGKLLNLIKEPAFTQGEFHGLNYANRDNPHFGRVDGETASGHWLYAFLRYDSTTGQAFLVIANFHPQRVLENVRIRFPESWIGGMTAKSWTFRERLSGDWETQEAVADIALHGLAIPPLPPCSAGMIEIFR